METSGRTARNLRGQRRRIALVAGTVAIAVVVAVAVFALTDSGPPGETAAEFALPNFQGETVRLSDFAGRPVVLNYWASWCAPCLAEMPGFEQVFQRHRDEVGFLGINLADNPSSALAVIERTGITYPVAIDADGSTYTQFGGFAMPTTVFISSDGRVLEVHAGILTVDQLEAKISTLFGT